MEWYNINCPDCGYHTLIVAGTPAPDESFDLNEDFSQYVPMLCRDCHSVVTVDVNDRRAEYDCPCGCEGEFLDEQQLQEIDCPACGSKNLKVTLKEK